MKFNLPKILHYILLLILMAVCSSCAYNDIQVTNNYFEAISNVTIGHDNRAELKQGDSYIIEEVEKEVDKIEFTTASGLKSSARFSLSGDRTMVKIIINQYGRVELVEKE